MTIYNKKAQASGFTLTELMVVIGIIGILSYLSLSGLGRVQLTMRQSSGISRLQQTGVAILSYASDNNGRLPGPAPFGIYSFYNKRDAKTTYVIASTVAVYMGMQDPSTLDAGQIVEVPALTCPGIKGLGLNTTSMPNFIQNTALEGITGKRPFGTQARGNTGEVPPTTMAVLSGLPGGLSGIWAITNVDREFPNSSILASGWSSLLPASPVYGNSRLRLYFDGHVAAVSKDAE